MLYLLHMCANMKLRLSRLSHVPVQVVVSFCTFLYRNAFHFFELVIGALSLGSLIVPSNIEFLCFPASVKLINLPEARP